jgi:hypothetical protein
MKKRDIFFVSFFPEKAKIKKKKWLFWEVID